MCLGSSFRRRSICILIGLVALVAGTASAADFTQVTTTAATAWGDWNNDGFSDMFSGSALWTNNQDGTFTQSSPFSNVGNISLGDYNNDGYFDVYGYVGGSGPRLYTNNAGSGWTNSGSKFQPGTIVNISPATTLGDFNGDGYLDTYVTGWCWPWDDEPWNNPEVDIIFTSNAGDTFSHTWTSPSPQEHGKGVTTVDFDRDGDLDIYVSNYWLSQNNLWRNDGFNGTTGLNDVAVSYGATTPNYQSSYGHTQGSAVGDFNNDGEFDIYVSNFAHMEGPSGRDNPKARFLENQGAAGSYHFTDKGLCGITQLEPFAGSTTGDFDNDGYLDLFITTSGGYTDSGKTRLYHNNGNWTFTQVDYGLSDAGEGEKAAWADYDNDGYLDIVAAGKLWRNPGTANWNNHYLKVKLQGGQGDNGLVNGSAIGAQVRIDVPGLGTVSRQVAANTGLASQNDLTMHFGLGSYDGPVDLEIFWPDGSTQVVTGVAVDQLTTVSLTPYTEPLSMELVPVSDPNTPQGYTTYDLMATVDTDLAAFEMILSADTPDSIYQHAGGNGYYEPNPFLVASYPELEFDTYVTMGAWPYPSPVNAIGGAVDILEGSVLTFDEQNLNITWATSGGSYQSGPGTFQVARITLANHATADYTVMGWQTDSDPVTIQGTIAANPDQLSMHMEEAADQTGVPAGYTTYEFYATTDTNLAAFEMILEASKEGGIYQHAGGNGYYEPNPFLIASYPELEFDTYVTMGAWPYPSPVNAIGGAVDILEGSVLTFDETTLNITWAISGGSYLSGPGTFLVARVTLANDSAASWILRGQQTGDEFPAVLTNGDIFMHGDADGDGFVGADDLVAVLTYWGQTDPLMGDLSGDGFVGADDYVEVLTYWGNGSAAPEPAPEPASLGLLLLGGLLGIVRRR